MAEVQSTASKSRVKNIAGERFGRLLAVRHDHTKGGNAYWEFLCDCGKTTITAAFNVKKGDSLSCGCLHDELAKIRSVTHGATSHGKQSPEYRVWKMMLARCRNRNFPDYGKYGGRGITVCERWATDYAAFLADVGPRPSLDYSLDRFPNQNGNYEPGNVRWATQKQQQRNRTNNVLLTVDGVTKCLSEWAELMGLKQITIGNRIRRGWDVKLAVTTPVRPLKSRAG